MKSKEIYHTNFNIDLKEFFIYSGVFLITLIIVINVISIVDGNSETEYDKCLDSCSLLRYNARANCLSECNNIIYLRKLENIDLKDLLEVFGE